MSYPQPGHPIQPVKKKSKVWLILGIVAALVLVCCGGGVVLVAMSADKPTAGTATGATDPAGKPVAAKIGTPVRDGKFEFTVKTVKCGVAKVGDQYFNKKAQGQFCLVTMSVKNIGTEAQMFDDSNQKAFGAGDITYEADGAAGLYANDDNQAFLNNINPGNTVTAMVVFDIAKGAKLTGLELHDSVFSGGIKVTL